MHISLARLLVALVMTIGLVAAESPPAAAEPDWKGDSRVQPEAYSWLNSYRPSDTYSIAIVRGMGKKRVLRVLGGVRKQLGDMTPSRAEGHVLTNMDTWPRVAQVAVRGRSVVIYHPYNFLTRKEVARLSAGRVAAEFITTVELDTYATVGKHGKVVRQFDVYFKPPKKGALPAEEGLDFGAKDQNVWATGWAFNERLTRIHLSREWFMGKHPTYLLKN